ncbi:MAG: hypothetical protein V7739_08985 [Motiliproteus sp.]
MDLLESKTSGTFPFSGGIDSENKDAKNINVANKIYGRRLYKDQTSVEYLSEMLLVFISSKSSDQEEKSNPYSFILPEHGSKYSYHPASGLAVKLFSFFPNSKLGTRHEVHRKTYIEILEKLKSTVRTGTNSEKDDLVRLLQSVLSGFVGVGNNRTWVTQSFLPAAEKLISCEINWKHTAAEASGVADWESSLKYFETNRHNFMARGGELIFLQLANLFKNYQDLSSNGDVKIYEDRVVDSQEVTKVQSEVESGLGEIINASYNKINVLSKYIENVLDDYELKGFESNGGGKVGNATLGWIHKDSWKEALLLAYEIKNITTAVVSDLEKLQLLQHLLSLHTLRSMCFQSARLDDSAVKINGFSGNYVWVLADPRDGADSLMRKMATRNFDQIENLLYRVLRGVFINEGGEKFTQAENHGFKIFRKLSKEIGLVIPPKGQEQRFVLSSDTLRLLVVALLSPGERITMDDFYERVFSHFGIVMGGGQLGQAFEWMGGAEEREYESYYKCDWIEDLLKRSGLLIELSDAVSIVINPNE